MHHWLKRAFAAAAWTSGSAGSRTIAMSMAHNASSRDSPRSCQPRSASRYFDRASLERVFAAADGIDTLIVGTGTGVWLPPSELREALRAVKVVLDAMQTGPAVRTYNIMIGERRRVAAALIAVP